MECTEEIKEYQIFLYSREIGWGLASSREDAVRRFLSSQPKYEGKPFEVRMTGWESRYVGTRTMLKMYDTKLHSVITEKTVSRRNTYLSILDYYRKWLPKEKLMKAYGGK